MANQPDKMYKIQKLLPIIVIFILAGCMTSSDLINPFDNVINKLPYVQPPTCGFSNFPSKSKSDPPKQAIRNTFEASGIQLQNNVRYQEDGIDIYLDGYNEAARIGFLFVDYFNFDDSLNYLNKHQKIGTEVLSAHIKGFEYKIEEVDESIKRSFDRFLKDKDKVIQKRIDVSNKLKKPDPFMLQLKNLSPQKESEALFNQYFLEQYLIELNEYFNTSRTRSPITDEILTYITNRNFENPIEKNALVQLMADHSVFDRFPICKTAFKKLKSIKSDEEFINHFLTMRAFLVYNSGAYQLSFSDHYNSVKSNIMENYPLDEWFAHIDQLDELKESLLVSKAEIERLLESSKKGKKMIAVISSEDPVYKFTHKERLPIIRKYTAKQDDIYDKLDQLRRNYNNKNGILEEDQEIYHKAAGILKEEMEAISMEQRKEIEKMTLQKLDREVKVFIEWANGNKSRFLF